jgi:hypothetical protein
MSVVAVPEPIEGRVATRADLNRAPASAALSQLAGSQAICISVAVIHWLMSMMTAIYFGAVFTMPRGGGVGASIDCQRHVQNQTEQCTY